jgi:hypothetical protein
MPSEKDVNNMRDILSMLRYDCGYDWLSDSGKQLIDDAVSEIKNTLPTVGDIERIIYNNKTALEAAVEIRKIWGEK